MIKDTREKLKKIVLTRSIKDAIKEGYTSDFIHLLEEFGRWSRYFGCMGWGNSPAGKTCYMDDETGAVLDLAFAQLKRQHPELHRLLKRYYIDGLNEVQIARELKGKGREFRYINSFMVADRIAKANLYILEWLQSCGQ